MPLAVDIGELQLGGRYNGSMWAMRHDQVLLSKVSRRGRAEVGRYCCANIKAGGRTTEVIGRWRSGWKVG